MKQVQMNGVSAPAARLMGASPATSRGNAVHATQQADAFSAMLTNASTQTTQAATNRSIPTKVSDPNSPHVETALDSKTGANSSTATNTEPVDAESGLVGLSTVQSFLSAPLQNTAASTQSPATVQMGFNAAPSQHSGQTAPTPNAAGASTEMTEDVVDELYQKIMGSKSGAGNAGPAKASNSVPFSQALLMMQAKQGQATSSGNGASTSQQTSTTQDAAPPTKVAPPTPQQVQAGQGATTQAHNQTQSMVQGQAAASNAQIHPTRAESRGVSSRDQNASSSASGATTSSSSTSSAPTQTTAATTKTQAAPNVVDGAAQAVKTGGQASAPSPELMELDLSSENVAELDGLEFSESESSRTSASTRNGQSTIPTVLRGASSVAAQAWSTMIQRFDGRSQQYQIRLDPAELGEIDVSIEISKDNKARIVMAVQSPEALNELSRSARALEQALAQSGVDVSEDGINFELSDDESGSFTFSGDDEPNEDENTSSTAQNAAPHPQNDMPEERVVTPQMSIWTRPGVDLKA